MLKTLCLYLYRVMTVSYWDLDNVYVFLRFNKLTERFFKTSPWPEAEVVAPIVQNGRCYLQKKLQIWKSLMIKSHL